MRTFTTLVSGIILTLSVFGAAACSGGGMGCGPTEEELGQQAQGAIQESTTTCGPGTRQEGNTCVRVNPQSNTPTAVNDP